MIQIKNGRVRRDPHDFRHPSGIVIDHISFLGVCR